MKNILNSNFKLLHPSETYQMLVIQKLLINFEAQKFDTVC